MVSGRPGMPSNNNWIPALGQNSHGLETKIGYSEKRGGSRGGGLDLLLAYGARLEAPMYNNAKQSREQMLNGSTSVHKKRVPKAGENVFWESQHSKG